MAADPPVGEPTFWASLGGVATGLSGLIWRIHSVFHNRHKELKEDMKSEIESTRAEMATNKTRKDLEHQQIWQAIDADRRDIADLRANTASRSDMGKLFEYVTKQFEGVGSRLDKIADKIDRHNGNRHSNGI